MASINQFLLLISPKKTGSSSLFAYLSQHPAIAAAKFKEPGFFSKDYRWEKGFDWYQSLWHWKPGQHKYALDATTDYLHKPRYSQVPERIKYIQQKQGVHFKFICVLRDPIERLEKQHFQDFYIDQHIDKPIYKEVNKDIVEATKYAQQLDAYFSLFPQEDILLLNFNEFTTQLDQFLIKICRFLKVDTHFAFDTQIHHNTKESALGYGSSLWQSLRNINMLKQIGHKVPSHIKDRLRSMLGKIYKNKVREEDYRLTATQKQIVLKQLQPDLKKLRNKYDFDTSDWETTKLAEDE